MTETTVEVLALLGFVISYYSLYVEKRFAQEKNYKPICDINDRISCSKAFTSKYGKFAGIPNPYLGFVFYLAVFLLAANGFAMAVFWLSAISLAGSLYLAYLQYFKVKTFCLVCTSLYVINILLAVYSYKTAFL
ncbi:vitamin K epoxide reductase family protein [Candidatus Woesearchaeota archaeon]|nr:vitamin K epoxide reductase family protein [Candidatus Woesearchaeota archaeon]